MEEKRGIAICGCTGSIGTQAIDVIEHLGGFNFIALVSQGNHIGLMAEQVLKYNPKYAVVIDEEKAKELERLLNGRTRTKILSGEKAAMEVCASDGVDLVLQATVGIAALEPTIYFLEHGKNVALANKESLVAAGDLVMETARRNHVEILPVDSEHNTLWRCAEPKIFPNSGLARHSVIWQLNHDEAENPIRRIILTASGGPFLGKSRKELENVTVQEALNHPKWKMGGRISIDSATLMNKGFEVMEAVAWFRVPIERVEAVIHPQSLAHSFVETVDGFQDSAFCPTDMRFAIQYALYWPRILSNNWPKLDLTKQNPLVFKERDPKEFECFNLAMQAAKMGGTAPAALNAADEVAVDMFLRGKIKFIDIPILVESCLRAHDTINGPNLTQILAADKWAREHVNGILLSNGTSTNLLRTQVKTREKSVSTG